MSINLPGHFVTQYSTNIALLLQTKGSKLRRAVNEAHHFGSAAVPVDQYGAVNANLVTTRFADMPRTDVTTDRRWVYPTDYDVNQLIDSFDRLRLITQPDSLYVLNAVYALGRAIDDAIITAFFGNANTGVAGATSTSFLSTQVVGVNTGGTASGFNVAKLRAGRKILMTNEVDLDNDPIFCAITAIQHDDLLNQIQIISSDFNGGEKPVLRDGKIMQFLGINFIHCERLTPQAIGTDDQSNATSIQIPMWAKSGMHLGMWNDINTDVSERKDLQSIPWQAYAKETIGATRLEEKKVVKIWCQPV